MRFVSLIKVILLLSFVFLPSTTFAGGRGTWQAFDWVSRISAPSGASENIYLPNASQGWTDYVILNNSSGNVTSGILGDTYTASGTLDYQVSGPNGLLGIQANASGEYLTNTSPNSALVPNTNNFVVLVQLKHQTGGASVNYVFDFDHNGTGTSEGFAMTLDGTNVDLLIVGDSGSHITRWAHGGDVWEDNTLWTLRYEIDLTQTKGSLTVKEEGQTETSVTTAKGASNLNTIGAINPVGGLRLLARENIDSVFFLNGPLYTFCIQVGGLTADLDQKP